MEGFGPLVGEAVEPLLDEVKINQGDRVLDLGTGPGLTAEAAAQRGAEVLGIDFSETMIAEARRLHPEIEFRKAAAETLPYEDGEFDAVVGNFVLHHSGNPEGVLAEAYRVLRPGGRMGMTVWGDPATLEAFGLFFAAVEEHAGSAELPHGPLFGVSDFAVFHRMVQDAGFRNSSVRETQYLLADALLGDLFERISRLGEPGCFPRECSERHRQDRPRKFCGLPDQRRDRHAQPRHPDFGKEVSGVSLDASRGKAR